jgi:hypothetical protein
MKIGWRSVPRSLDQHLSFAPELERRITQASRGLQMLLLALCGLALILVGVWIAPSG